MNGAGAGEDLGGHQIANAQQGGQGGAGRGDGLGQVLGGGSDPPIQSSEVGEQISGLLMAASRHGSHKWVLGTGEPGTVPVEDR